MSTDSTRDVNKNVKTYPSVTDSAPDAAPKAEIHDIMVERRGLAGTRDLRFVTILDRGPPSIRKK